MEHESPGHREDGRGFVVLRCVLPPERTVTLGASDQVERPVFRIAATRIAIF